MTFTTRARVRKSELSRQRVYRSLDGRWKLIDVRSKLGLGRYWLLVRLCYGGEYVVSRHRTRQAAEKRLTQFKEQ